MKRLIFGGETGKMYKYEWYWEKGLCDAEIIDIKKEDYNYDYRQRCPIRNMFEIVLDAKGAMYDTLVKSIRFYNYKIVRGGEDLLHTWWYDDEITEQGGRKQLKLTSRKSKDKFCELILIFDKAEIIR